MDHSAMDFHRIFMVTVANPGFREYLCFSATSIKHLGIGFLLKHTFRFTVIYFLPERRENSKGRKFEN